MSERETQIEFGILLKPMEDVIFSTFVKIQDNSHQNRKENNVLIKMTAIKSNFWALCGMDLFQFWAKRTLVLAADSSPHLLPQLVRNQWYMPCLGMDHGKPVG